MGKVYTIKFSLKLKKAINYLSKVFHWKLQRLAGLLKSWLHFNPDDAEQSEK